MDKSAKTIVIIPTYNECENIPQMVEAVGALSLPFDLLIVDDNSPDGTGELADQLALTYPFVHVLHRSEKNGLGRAYCEGFKWALDRGYEYICQMDADFSHDPADLIKLVEIAKDCDLVLGTRYKGGIRVINWPLNRLILSVGAARYVRIVTGMPFTDPTGGFKCFRNRALSSIELDQVRSNGYSFQIELTHKIWTQGMDVREYPIIFTDRQTGTSKMSLHIVFEAVHRVWGLLFGNRFRRSPLKRAAKPPVI
ncbi:MAG: polyprenol monophosphomannose synthase [Verrucomicrobiae bacterium]|nr:polyprenol monophosphomannose synthase [Verrucomicrobiae bacterium]